MTAVKTEIGANEAAHDAPFTPTASVPKSTVQEAIDYVAAQIIANTEAWGTITGTLSDQTDLQAALNAKLDDSQVSAFGLTLIDDADAAAARATLGVIIGTNVQAYDADLASWASVTRAAGFDAFAGTPSSANLATLVSDETGSGALVFSISPTLVTPNLGTPSALNLANATGLPLASGVIGTLSVANGGTGQTTAGEAVGELIQALTADTAPDWSVDYVGTYDDSADTGKKVLLSTITRERLTAARTYYVRTDGSDSNSGLQDTAGGAFLTIQKAIDVAASLDTVTFDVTIQVANGVYSTATVGPIAKQCVGAGQIYIVGNETTPTSVTINVTGTADGRGVFVSDGISTTYHVRGFLLQNSASGSCRGLLAISGAIIRFQNLNFGSGLDLQLRAQDTGTITSTGPYTISGGAAAHWSTAGAGVIRAQNTTITLTGTPAFTNSFATAAVGGLMLVNGNTFSGSATGPRYVIGTNSVCFVSGASSTYLPGSSAGSTATGGVYA